MSTEHSEGRISAAIERLRNRDLILPMLFFIYFFLAFPLLYLLFISVHTYDPVEVALPIYTIENYARIFLDQFYTQFVVYTLRLAAVVTALCVLLGYPIAYYLAKTTDRSRRIMLALVVLPLMVGIVPRTYGWTLILGRNGFVNSFLLNAGLVAEPLSLIFNRNAVILGLVGVLLPFFVLPTYSSIQQIGAELEEASRILGANKLQTLYTIVFPMSLPGVITGIIFCFTLSMSSVVTPKLLGGRTDVTIGSMIFDLVFQEFNWPFAAALAISIAVINLTLIYGYYKITNDSKEGTYYSINLGRLHGFQRRTLHRLPGIDPYGTLSRPVEFVGRVTNYLSLGISLLVLNVPIVIVLGVSLNATEQEVFPPNGVSLRWYLEFFQSPNWMYSFFLVSVPIAVVVAFLATAIGMLAAYAMVRADIPFKNLVRMQLLAPIMIPGIVIGLGLLIFFVEINVDSGYLKLVLGHTLRVLPYPLLTTIAILQTFGKEYEEASRNLGVNRVKTFRHVTIPLMRPGLIGGFLMAFMISFVDVNVALFLTEGDTITIPVLIFNEIQRFSSPLIAVVSALQVMVVLALLVVISRFVGFEAFDST